MSCNYNGNANIFGDKACEEGKHQSITNSFSANHSKQHPILHPLACLRCHLYYV